jgi:hypothetical protein
MLSGVSRTKEVALGTVTHVAAVTKRPDGEL